MVQTLPFQYPSFLSHSFHSLHFCKNTIRKYLHLAKKEDQKETLQHVMMGIPFYGYDNGSAIIGSQYLDLLKTHETTMEFNKKAQEHVTMSVFKPFLSQVSR